MMTLTLSSDHRVVDCARAAGFMRDVAEAIGNPQHWLAF
jgi:pyruvate/2-oxoglutarate dehydrogenase complex dihydrolipoamide acyltransferase (E2) component